MTLITTLIALLFGITPSFGDGGISQLQQWRSTSTPYVAITPQTYGARIYAPASHATTSSIAARSFCINLTAPDCITAWPSGSGSGFSTTSASYFSSVGLAFSTTSSDYWKTQNNFHSTTSANFWSSAGLGFSTTSAAYWKTQNTFEAITAGDALTRTGDDIDFDGGTTPSGDLAGTWASPSVTDDSHAHTGTTLSGIDISSDTNLGGTYPITLTGDTLSFPATSTLFSNLGNSVLTNIGGVVTASSTLGLDRIPACASITGGAGLCDGTDAGTTYTFTYPLVNTADTITIAFGTTTANTWADNQAFSKLTLTTGSSTAFGVSGIAYIGTASTSNLTISAIQSALLSTGATGIAQSTTVSAPLTFTSNTLAIPAATAGANGYITSGNWSLFNGKVSTSSIDSEGELQTALLAGANMLLETEIDGCSELLALLDDETGSCGGAVFSVSPALTGTPSLTGFLSSASSSISGLTTILSTSTNATSTTFFTTHSSTTRAFFTHATTSSLYLTNVPSALLLTSSTGLVGAYGGIDCTNQLVRDVSAAGAGTCASVASTDLAAGVFANPTGTIGLAAVNGSATTAMRSDGAPALSQSITPTWTGLHIFNTGGISVNASSTIMGSSFPAFNRCGLASSTPSALWGCSIGTSTVMQRAQFVVAIASSTSAGAIETVNWDNGNHQRFILDENTAFVINSTSSNPRDGGRYILEACQDGTGSRVPTFITGNTHIRWANNATPTITATANKCTLIGFIFESLNTLYRGVGSTTNISIN